MSAPLQVRPGIRRRAAGLLARFSPAMATLVNGAPIVARPAARDFSIEVPLGFTPELPVPGPTVAVVCHIFHADLAAYLCGWLAAIPVPADVYISTDTAEKQALISAAFATWPNGTVDVRIVPNRGRDIAPKLLSFRDVYERYDLVLFLHSKKSPHLAAGEQWREYLLRTLLGSAATVRGILAIFDLLPSVGMVIPQHFGGVRDMIEWGSNYPLASELAQRMGFSITASQPLDLPSGSMFWARTKALAPLLSLSLPLEDFPEEAGQIDGTLAHAIERLLLHTCEHAGFDWLKVADATVSADRKRIATVHTRQALHRFLERHRFHLLRNPGAST